MFPSGNHFRSFGMGKVDRSEKKYAKLAWNEFVSRIKEGAKLFPCMF